MDSEVTNIELQAHQLWLRGVVVRVAGPGVGEHSEAPEGVVQVGGDQHPRHHRLLPEVELGKPGGGAGGQHHQLPRTLKVSKTQSVRTNGSSNIS